jgi:hypothetical protein
MDTLMRETHRIKLGELAFACHIYGAMSGYDESYREFLGGTRPLLDLHNEQHVKALLNWLDDWGCRQFVTAYHCLAAKEITDWYERVAGQLFPIDTKILSLSEEDLAAVERAYAGLVHRMASKKVRAGREFLVEIGPTGAAKILFALRPKALIPWDIPMRAKFHLNGTARSYCSYLRHVREQLESLSGECSGYGLRVGDLPQILGRPESSLPKLIDEYHWVTISRKCSMPHWSELGRWLAWS